MGNISSFAFTISLAAVINGLGLVRLLTGLAAYVQSKERANMRLYWVYALLLFFQFLMHILMWWAMFGTSVAGALNFFQYLYLLLGPILLFLATSILLPELDDTVMDLAEIYRQVADSYFTAVALLWLWAIFLWPTLVGVFAPAWPIFAVQLSLALALRSISTRRAHEILVSVYCFVILLFIAMYQIRLGGTAEAVMERIQ